MLDIRNILIYSITTANSPKFGLLARACMGGEEKSIYHFGRNNVMKGHLEDLSVGYRVILQSI